MKTKPLFTLLLSFFFISAINAQEIVGPYSIATTNAINDNRGFYAVVPLVYNDYFIQVQLKWPRSLAFQKISNDGKLQKENIVITDDKLNKSTNYQYIAKLKNKTYLFGREIFKETKTEGMRALEFSPDKLDFIGESKSLYQLTDKLDFNGPAAFIFSEDKTKFACLYKLKSKKNNDKKNTDVFGMYVFDENLHQLLGNNFQLPYTEAIMDNLGYTLTNNGEIYLLAKVYNEKRVEAIDGRPNYHYEILVFNKDNAEPIKLEIDLDKLFLKNAFISIVKGEVIVAGCYATSEKNLITGMYVFKLNPDRSKLMGASYEIPSDVIKAFESEKMIKKSEKKEELGYNLELSNLYIKNVLVTSNGSIKIVAEHYHLNYDKIMDHSYGDIYVTSISAKGELEWFKKVPKNQHSLDGDVRYLSVGSFVKGDDLHIFYNDNPSNENLAKGKSPNGYLNSPPSSNIIVKGDITADGRLMVVDIDKDGEMNKYKLGSSPFIIQYFYNNAGNNVIHLSDSKISLIDIK